MKFITSFHYYRLHYGRPLIGVEPSLKNQGESKRRHECISSQLNCQITPYHATQPPLFYEHMRRCTDEENRKTMLPRQTSASVEIFGPLQMLFA
jgi:hypothetical protein